MVELDLGILCSSTKSNGFTITFHAEKTDLSFKVVCQKYQTSAGRLLWFFPEALQRRLSMGWGLSALNLVSISAASRQATILHTRCYGRHNFFQDRQPLNFLFFSFSVYRHEPESTSDSSYLYLSHDLASGPREPDVHVLQTSTDQVVLYRTCGWISAWSALSKRNVFSTRTCYRKLTAIPRQAGRHMNLWPCCGGHCVSHFERSVKFDIGPLQGASSGSTD
jgi:hypothetical protein